MKLAVTQPKPRQLSNFRRTPLPRSRMPGIWRVCDRCGHSYHEKSLTDLSVCESCRPSPESNSQAAL
jgi:acetyl-CoA carboxylase beta subunit